MFSQRVRNVIDPAAMLTAGPDATVREAARLVAGSPSVAVLVVENEEIKGIFTASDAMRRVLAGGLDPDATRLAEVMTSPVRAIGPDWTYGHALQLLHELGFRQLPVVQGSKPIGVLCARDALDPELEEFACEAQRREAYAQGEPVSRLPEGKA